MTDGVSSYTAVDRLRAAAARGDAALPETDALDLLDAIGIRTAARVLVRDEREALAVVGRTRARRVVKAVSPFLAHKTELGAVAVVEGDGADVAAAVRAMSRRLEGLSVRGFLVADYVEHEPGLGGELLLGLRWTDEFGPVATLGAGGVHAEFLAASLRESRSTAALTPGMSDAEIARAVAETASGRLLTRPGRGLPAAVGLGLVVETVGRFLGLAALMPAPLLEFEVNPLVVSGGALVAVDALARLGEEGSRPPAMAARPLAKIGRLLEPRSIAVAGVSERRNPGRIILENLRRASFDPTRTYVVKPGTDSIADYPCVPDVASLPEPVDLLVVAVGAAQAPAVVREAVASRRAESVIVIPGGLEEKAGGGGLAAEMRGALDAARRTEWGGPVLNGGNCLGVRSAPGHYDTLFIPQEKLPPCAGGRSPLAYVSQSGAFAIARMSKLSGFDPRYTVTLGNQTDLTVADYLEHLATDEHVRVFAVYVEGFKPGDGARFLRAARALTAAGRTVVLYRAGRTPDGARATASHTASIAGDYGVTRALARACGVVVAETLDDFDDLVRLATALGGRRVDGPRLAAVSNAGYECVAFADALGGLEIAALDDRTTCALRDVLRACKLDGVVEARNPLDLTPMADDDAYEAAVAAVIASPAVDVAVVGCVPLTAALRTLPDGDGRFDDASVVGRLVRINAGTDKAMVAVVDSGAPFDPMARALEAGGVPTFRSADRAVRLLGAYCRSRVGAATIV